MRQAFMFLLFLALLPSASLFGNTLRAQISDTEVTASDDNLTLPGQRADANEHRRQIAEKRALNGLPAMQALAFVEAGDEQAARTLINAAATTAINTREFEEWFEAGSFLSDLNMVLAGGLLEGKLGPVLSFGDMAFSIVADTPLVMHDEFITFANYRASLCAVVGNIDCIEECAGAALAQIDQPTGNYENRSQRTALQWRAMAYLLRGERHDGNRLLNVLASAVGAPDPMLLASELESLASLHQSMAPQIRQAMLREAILVLEKAEGRDHRGLENRIHGNLGVSYHTSGMLAEAEASYRAAWRISEREFSPDSVGAISDSSNLARLLAGQDRWDEALPLFRRNWEIADAYRDWSLNLHAQVADWAYALINIGQMDEADRVTERVMQEVRATPDVSSDDLSLYLSLRGTVMVRQQRFAEAEPLLREAIAANSQNDLSGGATMIANLAAIIEAQGRHAEAEPLRRRSYEAQRQNILLSAFSIDRIMAGVELAQNLSHQGKDTEAEALFDEMMALARERADPAGEALRIVASAQARHLLGRGAAHEATSLAALALRISADALDLLGQGTSERTYLTAAGRQREAALLLIETRLTAGALDEVALADLFEAGQRAQSNFAASAMALNAAQALAGKAGAEEAVALWQAARADVTALDQRIAAFGGLGASGDADRRPLLDKRELAIGLLRDREKLLVADFPRFFDLARPSPATLTDTRSLLGPEEALILMVPGAGGEASFGGMVLTLTREGAAVAQIPLNPVQLATLTNRLHSGLAASGSGFTDADEYDPPEVTYERAAALQMYLALFGETQVASLLSQKSRWTLAPQQGLMGVAFDALVTAAPPGDTKGDADPASLRATSWLGIERAVAVTPSVSALVLARTAQDARRVPTQPFFGLGDPAFKGSADPPVSIPEGTRDRSLAASTRAPGTTQAYFRGPVADLASISRLARLPGTAIEIAALSRILGSSESTILTQLDATEASLRVRDATGELGSAGLVVFATHGLIAGELSGAASAEPALVLTPPAGVTQDALTPDNDGLLTATEAAGFTLSAEWVILSACNTSAADGRDPEGLSGLARGFFYAGAQSLLVSHFPVSDRATPNLTATAVVARQEQGLSRAEAMRTARATLLADTEFDDEGMSLAHPKAWAALALIDPGQ